MVTHLFFFLGGVTATAPSRDLTDNKKKEERGLKQRRKQKEAAQGDPEPKKGNQEKEKKSSRDLFSRQEHYNFPHLNEQSAAG